MENKSLIQGTTWYWRKTFLNVPMHSSGRFSGAAEVKELCLIVDHLDNKRELIEELNQNQIRVNEKEVHLASEHIPEGSKILYARQPNKKVEDDATDYMEMEENLEKLKDYIFKNGGEIDGELPPLPPKKISFNLFQLFRRERK